MFKTLIAVLTFLLLGACGAYTKVDVRAAIAGENLPTKVKVTGRLYSIGVELSSLHPVDSDPMGSECLALILNSADRARARRSSRKLVRVTASPIAAGDMKTMFPSNYGTINGRPWSGTKCHGEYILFVHDLAVLS